MPLPIEYNLHKTKNAYEFEEIVCDVCIKKYGRAFQRFGSQGQKQFGVDIISVDQGELVCVQCKNYAISSKEINDIIDEATQFNHPISQFIIATNGSRNTKLQEQILNKNYRGNLDFEVGIMFWNEISSIISQHEDLLLKYYPKTDKDSIEWLISEFNRLMYTYDVFGFANVDPIIGMPENYPGQIDIFVFEVGEKLMQVNNLQHHPKFIAVNSFRNIIDDYNGYLSIKLFPSNKMYTIQNPFDLVDISKQNSEIRNIIFNYKKEMGKIYEQINEGCSMFLVKQHL